MKIRLSLTLKLTLIFMIFSALILGVAGLLAYANGRSALQTAAEAELYSAALEKQGALDDWIAGAEDHVIALAVSPYLQEQTAGLMVARATGDQPAIQAAHAPLVAELQAWAGYNSDYLEWMVLDAQSGQIAAATTPGDEGKFKEDQPYFTNGKTGLYVQNLYYSLSEQSAQLTISTPIRSKQGVLLGVLAGNLDLAEMNEIITRRTGLRQSDDAFLVNTSSVFVTQPRFISDPAVLLRGIHTVAVNRCLAHDSGEVNAGDYRGVPAIIVYRWLPERQLCLIVKIDQAEALAPALALRSNIILISLLALLAAAVLAYWLAHNITRPVQQLVQAAHAIGAGQLDTPIAVSTGDEIEQLAGALAQMASDLQSSMVSRDNLLAEIAGRKVVEEALRETNDYLENLFNYANAPIIVWDPQFRITRFNHAFEALTGQSAAEVLGKPLEILFPPAQSNASMELIRKTLTGERWEIVEIAIQHVNGSLRTLIWNSATLFSVDGQIPVATIAQGQDITERKRAEEELKRSNAELERFAYIASHDLQEPLRMVTSYLQLLERRYKGQLDQDADEFIAYAVDGVTRMKALINDLLAYSRVGTRGQEFALVACEEVLARVLANLQFAIAENKASVTHDALPQVMGDAAQLESLFQNLIGNALKFHSEKPPVIHVGVEKKDKEWVFSVRDNGIGIEPQYFERIFILFQRLHNHENYPGTGIGLAISKRIVERHGGRMWIESQPGNGSTFYFTLPKIM